MTCRYCPRKYKSAKYLRAHTKSHTNPFRALFRCVHCDKAFGMKCLLKNHLRRHTGERPFQCPDCPKRYMRKYYLTSHLNNCHLTCLNCDKKFETQSQLAKHKSGCYRSSAPVLIAPLIKPATAPSTTSFVLPSVIPPHFDTSLIAATGRTSPLIQIGSPVHIVTQPFTLGTSPVTQVAGSVSQVASTIP